MLCLCDIEHYQNTHLYVSIHLWKLGHCDIRYTKLIVANSSATDLRHCDPQEGGLCGCIVHGRLKVPCGTKVFEAHVRAMTLWGILRVWFEGYVS